jgi:hypothetical protein
MRLRGWFVGGKLLALFTVANLLLGVGLFALRSPERQNRNVPPPELPAQIKELIALMDGKHGGQSFTLTLTDAELSDTVGHYIAESNEAIPFSDVRVSVNRAGLVVNGRARGGVFVVPVTATLTVGVANGKPAIQVEQVSLGSTGLPGPVSRQIIAEANTALDLSAYDLGVTLEAIELGDGVATVRGTIN